ncbi:mboat family protein [Ophiostoma piceae UAMH 11346]|uniref:O-acyltransferase n=1 Tax=Ophiostoma piceae (strain UAMH 11346) TaxID=1262450 RepID=S3BSL7_OPHP1|nr:mboat family protein [Ophiostoma piceae UAMH 11346]
MSIGLAHLAIGNGCTTLDRPANTSIIDDHRTHSHTHTQSQTKIMTTPASAAHGASTSLSHANAIAGAGAGAADPRRRTTTKSHDAAPEDVSANNSDDAEDTLKDILSKEAALQQLRRAFQRKYRHVAAIHSQTQPSCLSHDNAASPSFLGFRNLMVIVLVVGNLRLMIENIQKYGVLICVRCHDFRQHDVLLGLVLVLSMPIHLLIAFLIELAAADQALLLRKRTLSRKEQTQGVQGTQGAQGTQSPTEDEARRFRATWHLVAWLHAVNISLALAIASYVVYFHIHHPLIGTLAEAHAIVVWLKTFSYAFTNRDLRHAYLHPARGERESMPALYALCPYPDNITVGNLIYFWGAPTLVYQPAYPRSPGPIRWMFVAKRMVEVFALGAFIWFCSAQYAAPVLQNSLTKIESLDVFAILERLLKLSTISLVIWLAGFFAVFQSFLNAVAEVTRFGDREFYEDWWNSDSLGAYWRTWNKPVYHFFRRHVYSPLIGRGWRPMSASLVVFFVSAVLHELAVGIPTHNIIGVAFFGMFLQLPLIAITTPLEKMHTATGRLIGNCTFWVSFTVFGQPFAALMYFYAWQAKYGSVSKQA